MSLPLPPEVPAYVRHENYVNNHVAVEGGTNWDFSRSAVATPISPAVDPVPTKLSEMDAAYLAAKDAECNTFVASVTFPKGSAVIPLNSQKVLKKLSSSLVFTLEGHAQPLERKATTLAQRRDAVVKAFLLKNGKHVTEKSLTGTTGASKQESPRVDIFVGD